MTSRTGFILLLLAVAPRLAGTGDQGPASKPTIPDTAELRRAAESVDQVYAQEIAKARDAESKSALAARINEVVSEEHDPAAKYVLLWKALELATQAGDADAACGAIDQIAAAWNVDVLKLRAKTLTDVARNLRTPESRTDAARRMEAVAQEAIIAREFDLARTMRELAVGTAQRGSDPALAKLLAARSGDIGRIKSAEARVKPSVSALKDNPSDPAANLAVGRCESFLEGNWSAGLPKLARSGDSTLKSLAQKDLADPTDPTARLELADQWWDLSKREDEPARRNIQLHATGLYRQAVAKLIGLAKVRAQQRIAEGEAQSGAMPAAADTANVRVVNRTNAREGAQIISEVLRDFPDTLAGVKQATLLAYHNGSEFRHAGSTARAGGQFFSSAPAAADSGGFLFWDVHEQWPAGKFLLVYRIAQLSPASEGDVCVADIYDDGKDLASRHMTPAELPPGQWAAIPMLLNLEKPGKGELRVFTYKKHSLALDRVYLYQLRWAT
jgi:hypothetical protein